jgi:hypothetical protein
MYKESTSRENPRNYDVMFQFFNKHVHLKSFIWQDVECFSLELDL